MAHPDVIRADPAPHLHKRPRDYGVGRRCVECGCRVGRYTTPQPITGDAMCNVHWRIPDGYLIGGPTLHIRKDYR